MQANLNIGQTATYELTTAMLIYEVQSSYASVKGVAVTVHPIVRKGRRPTLGAGSPITHAAVESLASALGRNLAACWLPPNIVSLSFSQIAWFVPAARRRLWFKPDGRFNGGAQSEDRDTKPVLKLNGKFAHHPPLLFIAGTNSLRVFALIENKRPAPTTQLYRAPYWNLWEDGKMCNGNRKLADLPTPASIPAFEDGFFNSAFSHTNIKRICTHPGGHTGLWQELTTRHASAPDSAYWRKNLLKMPGRGLARNTTLEQVLTGSASES